MGQDTRASEEETQPMQDEQELNEQTPAEAGEAEAILPAEREVASATVQAISANVGREVRKQELRPGQQKRRQMKVGRVVSDKMDKTIIVAVEYTRPHPLYKKAMKRTSKFAAHDEQNECKIGDIVRIEETRPLSKTKRWIVREVIQRRVVV
jgi:small subunit ribosomal protein S17